MPYQEKCMSSKLFKRKVVLSPGFEPGSPAPQAGVLSIELRERSNFILNKVTATSIPVAVTNSK